MIEEPELDEKDAQDEVAEASPEEDDGPPERTSFFSASRILDAKIDDVRAWEEIEEADARVCRNVWSMFAKDSNQRGIDARTVQQRAASGVIARRRETGDLKNEARAVPRERNHDETEAKMAKEMDTSSLPDRQRSVLDVLRAAEAKGEDLSNAEIAKRAGLNGKDAGSLSANVSSVRAVLRERGLFGETAKPAPKARAPKTVRTAPPPKPAPARDEPRAKRRASTPAADGDPILEGLVARRDAIVEKISKLDAVVTQLDAAIEALRAAS